MSSGRSWEGPHLLVLRACRGVGILSALSVRPGGGGWGGVVDKHVGTCEQLAVGPGQRQPSTSEGWERGGGMGTAGVAESAAQFRSQGGRLCGRGTERKRPLQPDRSGRAGDACSPVLSFSLKALSRHPASLVELVDLSLESCFKKKKYFSPVIKLGKYRKV